MVTRHILRKIKSKKVKKIDFEDGKPSITGGYKNEFDWSVNGMLRLLNLQNGQLNGRIVDYRVKIKIDPNQNEIYGARHMKVFNLANAAAGGDPSDEYIDGDVHTGTVSGKI